MIVSSRGRLVPLLYPLLALLGVALMIWFGAESTPTAAIDLSVDRREAGALASTWLREQGSDPDHWWSTTSYVVETGAQSYLLAQTDRVQLEALAAEDVNFARWEVRFFRPLHPEQWRVLISSRSGRVLGFDHTLPAEQAGATLPISAAQTIAAQALPVDVASVRLVARSTMQQPQRSDHRFTWEQPARTVAEARYRYTVAIQGDQLGQVREYYFLPESWWREGAWHARRGALLATIGWTISALLLVLIGFTWLLEARRGRLRRGWAVRLTFAVTLTGLLVMLNSIPLDLASYDVNQSLGAYMVERALSYGNQFGTLIVTIVLAGMTGEALLWEQSQGKHHLSAALTRRGLVSRPVAQALLIGGLVGVFQLGFVSAFYALGGRWFGVWSPVTAFYNDTLSTPFPAVYGLAIGLLPAVGEELLFRLGGISVVQRWLGKPRLAVVATAVVWASLHATYEQRPFYIRVLELSLVGIGLGALYLRYGVLAAMAAHYTYNASLFVPLFWGSSWLYLASGVLMAAGAGLLLLPAVVRRLRGGALEEASVLAAPLPAALPPLPLPRVPYLARLPWRHLLLGAGSALLALLLIGWTLTPPLRRTMLRADALGAARALGQELGFDTTALHPAVQPSADWVNLDLLYLYDTLDRAGASAVVAEHGVVRGWMVRWSAWDRLDSWQVDLGPDGETLALRRSLTEDAPGATLPVSSAERLALAAVARYTSDDLASYALVDSATSQRTARTDHSFTWQTNEPIAGAAYGRIMVEIQGDQLGSLVPSLYTPPDYRRQREQTTMTKLFAHMLPSALDWLVSSILVLMGLIGVARRRIPIRPWALLGVVAAGVLSLLALGRITNAQLAEGSRLALSMSWALWDSALAAGELALLGAGAAAAWSWGFPHLPGLTQQLAAWRDRGRLWRDGLGFGLLLLPWGLLFFTARNWEGPRPGAWAGVGALSSVLPAADVLGTALITSLRTSLLLIGAVGIAQRVLRGRTLASVALVALGLLLAASQLDLPAHVLVALLACPFASLLAYAGRGNVIGIWFGLWLLSITVSGIALIKTGGGWYLAQGWLVLIVPLILIVNACFPWLRRLARQQTQRR